jgi:uncharacterized membrane protein YhaH (DUF805 family)
LSQSLDAPTGLPTKTLLVWTFFALKGRIGRRVYWLAQLFIIALDSVFVLQLLGGEEARYHGVAVAVTPFLLVVSAYSTIAVAVKRLHDFDTSGFVALALCIPLLDMAFRIWAGIVPGTSGPNRFGAIRDVPPQ